MLDNWHCTCHSTCTYTCRRMAECDSSDIRHTLCQKICQKSLCVAGPQPWRNALLPLPDEVPNELQTEAGQCAGLRARRCLAWCLCAETDRTQSFARHQHAPRAPVGNWQAQSGALQLVHPELPIERPPEMTVIGCRVGEPGRWGTLKNKMELPKGKSSFCSKLLSISKCDQDGHGQPRWSGQGTAMVLDNDCTPL